MEYIFDGTYSGYLTSVFECYARKELSAVPITEGLRQPDFFSTSRNVITDPSKSKRVLDGLEKKGGNAFVKALFSVFLSEDPQAWLAAFKLIQHVLAGNSDFLKNFGDSDVLYFSQTVKKVSRERHRMKAFVRFQKSEDGMYFAVIEPDFNVLPLIADFFRKRYADQPWVIYDVKRRYGLLFDKVSVSEVEIVDQPASGKQLPVVSIDADERDALFQQLWKQYFKSTNIEARRNMKLHLRHVPKRYWKYLTEKQ